jgi:hypothetical protein
MVYDGPDKGEGGNVRLGKFKTIGRAAIVMGVLVGGITLSTPAHADIPDGAHPGRFCKKGSFCIFEDVNYGGDAISQVKRKNRPNVGKFMNDRASSLWNRTNHLICVYQDANYGGHRRAILPGDSHHDLNNDYFSQDHSGSPMNDRISSWKRC